MSLGERFKRARKSIPGLTQLRLANAIGCDPGTVSRVERGEIKPSLNIAQKWAEICGVPLSSILDRDNASDSCPPGAP